ncbi:hypothetical protein BGZ82_001928 [Podila clonocystis]|nr:hypothetical protein BGZ82_001928 [Podila clonocystis]
MNLYMGGHRPAIEPGKYLIENNGHHLGLGSIPRDGSPEVVVILTPRDSPLVEIRGVKSAGDGTFRISTQFRSREFSILNLKNRVFASPHKAPELWAITSVGDGQVEIKLPYSNEVFTSPTFAYTPVLLMPAEGRDQQKWRFIPVERDNYYRGSNNRFCRQ